MRPTGPHTHRVSRRSLQLDPTTLRSPRGRAPPAPAPLAANPCGSCPQGLCADAQGGLGAGQSCVTWGWGGLRNLGAETRGLPAHREARASAETPLQSQDSARSGAQALDSQKGAVRDPSTHTGLRTHPRVKGTVAQALRKPPRWAGHHLTWAAGPRELRDEHMSL